MSRTASPSNQRRQTSGIDWVESMIDDGLSSPPSKVGLAEIMAALRNRANSRAN